ncbi:MAG: TerB family tellurite resistance protein [Kiloniellales bacterium]|nr:TerB family tellurite resistance protein [Kiloniellales bacterium]
MASSAGPGGQSGSQDDLTFLEAAMAASALAAFADGTVSGLERHRIGAIIVRLQQTRISDSQAALDLLDSYLRDLETDAEAAEGSLTDKIRAIAADRAAAELIASIVLTISQADDAFVYAEKMQFQEICALLELDPERIAPL